MKKYQPVLSDYDAELAARALCELDGKTRVVYYTRGERVRYGTLTFWRQANPKKRGVLLRVVNPFARQGE